MKTSAFLKLLLTTAAFFAVGSALSAPAWAEDIVIGAAVAQSGWMNAFDGPSLSGFKVFLDQLNAKGGVNGKKFVLKIVDTKTEQAGSKDAATQLINDGAQILLTSANFDFGAPGGNVAQAKGMLNFSLGAASPLYGPQGIGPAILKVGNFRDSRISKSLIQGWDAAPDLTTVWPEGRKLGFS